MCPGGLPEEPPFPSFDSFFPSSSSSISDLIDHPEFQRLARAVLSPGEASHPGPIFSARRKI